MDFWDFMFIAIILVNGIVYFIGRARNNEAYAKGIAANEKLKNIAPDRMKVQANLFVDKARVKKIPSRIFPLIEGSYLGGALVEKEYQENIIARKKYILEDLKKQLQIAGKKR